MSALYVLIQDITETGTALKVTFWLCNIFISIMNTLLHVAIITIDYNDLPIGFV